MVILPDGASFDMQWKQVQYIRNNNYIIFEIIPMVKGKDIVLFPNAEKWKSIQNVFSGDEREEILFLLERINWKRELKIAELNIDPVVNQSIFLKNGILEKTSGYQELSKENLFDVDSPLDKEQVKEVYCVLEKRFASELSGSIAISKDILIDGSVFKEITLPALKKNENVILEVV